MAKRLKIPFRFWPEENIDYVQDDIAYSCCHCLRAFPLEYAVKNPRAEKPRGTDQLMRLHAWNNFRRHVFVCRSKDGS